MEHLCLSTRLVVRKDGMNNGMKKRKKINGMSRAESGRLGGIALSKKLSKKKRRERALKAIRARWAKRDLLLKNK